MRIVTLTCSNTEIVCALGRAGDLVGVDDHSDFPEDVVSRLPRVGPDLDVDVERVAALAPDLVLASLTVPGHERIVERLERARLPFVVTEPVSVTDVYADVIRVGELLGERERAAELVRDMRVELDARPPRADRPQILVEWWPKPVIVPGRDSWVAQMLAAAGARGPLDAEPVKSRPITDDEARAFDPDAVVIAWCGVPFEKYRPVVVSRRPAWRELSAVRRGRIFRIPEAYLGRPGPRLVDGVRALRDVVRECAGG
ncbi:MAG TPA: cobalamin-binding protein [Polyangiaceae bacterium]|nr:cobalamin-binding protein [Polyangiaceae bacterium]